MTYDFKRTLTKRTKNVFNTLFFKEIDEKNVEEFFDVEKNNLFYNVVTQQLRRNDVRETCNSERQMKSFFKLLMIQLEKFQEKKLYDYKNTKSVEVAESAQRMRDS